MDQINVVGPPMEHQEQSWYRQWPLCTGHMDGQLLDVLSVQYGPDN